MKNIREKILLVTELDNDNNSKWDECYSYFMMVVIIMSLIPLFTRERNIVLILFEDVSLVVFIFDYIARLFVADLKLKKGWKSFVYYPFTFFAIIDLLSIIPSFTAINNGFKALKALRVIKCFKAFKMLRYSKSFMMLIRVFKSEKNSLLTVLFTSIAYVVITALVMYNAEIHRFETYFDSLYWASTALTTVGYGDIYPVTDLGKWISMMSSFMGIALVAIPSGIITAGYMREVNAKHSENDETKS